MDFSPDIQIPTHLQPYISHVWHTAGIAANAFPIYADGRTGIIFQQSGMILSGKEKNLSNSFVFGQTLAPIIL